MQSSLGSKFNYIHSLYLFMVKRIEEVISMIVKGWNNGSPDNRSGAGYGIRITKRDRDRYFEKTWTFVIINLGNGDSLKAKLSNSFWKDSKPCVELRSAKIGKWMIDHNLAPWSRNSPPNLELEHIEKRIFRLS